MKINMSSIIEATCIRADMPGRDYSCSRLARQLEKSLADLSQGLVQRSL